VDIATRDDEGMAVPVDAEVFQKVKPKTRAEKEAAAADIHAGMFNGKLPGGRGRLYGQEQDRLWGKDHSNHVTLETLIEQERPVDARKEDEREFPIGELKVEVRETRTPMVRRSGEAYEHVKRDLILAGGREQGVLLSPRGLETLGSYFEVPETYIRKLVERDLGDLAATNVNTLIDHKTARGAAVEKCLARFINPGEGSGGERTLRAVASRDYGIFNNLQVMELFLEGFRDWGGEGDIIVANCTNDTDRLWCNLYPADRMVTKRGDSDYGLGFAVKNSECLQSTLSLKPYLFRNACLNGCIVDRHDGTSLTQRHTGAVNKDDFVHRVKTFLGAAMGKTEALLELFQLNKEVAVPMPDPTIAHLARAHGLTRDQGKQWSAAFRAEPDYNGFGIINALTRAAQGLGFIGEKREQMETLAGSLIAPSLSADLTAIERRWSHINTMAKIMEEEEPVQVRAYALMF
jgi:hypothetical protein